ncbi:hypothetical protein D7X33_08480 [Butyricicoccus sp. 1XD8-22]|nr:hypothetical protein D7X33_08480 [Butyricicoccus sp. 1XD8-22]
MSRYGDWFREERKKEQGAASPSTAGTAAGGRRRSLAAIDAQAEQTRSQLQRMADEITARQGGQSPLERLAGEMAAAPAAPQLRDTLRQGLAAAQEIGRRRAAGTASAAKATLAPYLSGGSGRAQPLQASGLLPGRMVTSRAAGPSPYQRIGYGTDAAISGLAGSIGSALETGKAALGGEVDFLRDTGLKGYFTTPLNDLGAARQSEPYRRQMDMGSAAAKLMQRSAEKTQAAVEGLGPVGQWVGENLISVGQNLPAMAAAAIPVAGPFVSGGLMAASAGGGKAYELQQQGGDAGDAFWRGAVSGGIELATEKFSVENFLQIAKGMGAKTAAKNILRQMGVEASEESASYVLNYIADKAARDPDAGFSFAELANAAAGGAFSGGVFGGVGTVVHALGGNGRKNYQYLKARDGGATPDFDRQYRHYYEQARTGLAEDKSVPYPTQTPLDGAARQSARFAGRNDGKAQAQETAKTILEASGGGPVSDKALDRALAFPESRRAIEAVTGTLPEEYSKARKAVREWQAATARKTAKTVENPAAGPAKSGGAPGLVRNEYSARLDAQTAGRLDRIAKRAGVSVVFSDRLGDAAGEYRDGQITLRTGTENPEMRVLVHELTHHLETSGDYRALSDSIVKFVEQEKGVPFAALIRQQQDDYARFGDTLTEDGARRELIANFAQDYLFTDERSIRRLARENRSLVQKIRDWLRGLVARFTGSREEREQARFLRQAEQLYTRALESAEGRRTGETQYSIETLPNGKRYVRADRQVIHGDDSKQWLKQSQQFINQKVRGGEDITVFSADGRALQITERSAYKLADPRVQSVRKASGAELSDDQKALKARIAGHIDEVIQTAQKFKSRPDVGGKHQNDIGEDGFNYYATYFEDTDGQYYRVVFSSGVNENAETTYSIGDIQKRRHPTSNGSSAQKGGALSVAMSPNISVAQLTPDVKRENGDFVYRSAGKQQEVLTPDSIDTAVRADENASANVRTSENSITQDTPDGKEENGDFAYRSAGKQEALAPDSLSTADRIDASVNPNARTPDNSITYDTPDGKKETSGGQKSRGASFDELLRRAGYASAADSLRSASEKRGTYKRGEDPKKMNAAPPGLIETEVSRRMKAEDREFLDTLFQAAGVRGAVVSQESSIENAHIKNGVVTVYANADDAASAYRGTVQHEITHRIKELGAESYQAYEDFAVAQLAARGHVQAESLIRATQVLYREQAGQEMTEAQAREELAGNFAMTLGLDTESVRQFVGRSEQNRQAAKGILQTIRDILRRIWEKFTGRSLSREQRAFVRQLGEGERLWAQALGEASQRANENAAQTDGETRFSIKQAADGSQYVEVDTDILEGVSRKNWVKTVKEHLKSMFPNGVQVGNNVISISAQTRREMTFSGYAKWLRQNSSDLYADKLRAAAFSDEILLTSSNYVNEGLKHSRKDGIRDFARGTVQLRIGAEKYSADVIVGTKANGQMLLYDIVNIQKKADAPYSLGKSRAVDNGASADTSITDFDGNVNPEKQFSLKGGADAAVRLARYIDRHGALPRGEHAVRDILFPKRMDADTRVRRFSRTAAESASLTGEQAGAIGAAVAGGRFHYEPVGDRAARKYAEDMLARGEKAASDAWAQVVARDARAGKNDIALGEYLLREAAKAGDTERVVQLAAEIAAEGTRAGQVVQAMRLLKKLDGAGQLVALDATLKKLQGELDRGKSRVFLEVPEALREKLAAAKGEDEVSAVLDEIYTALAKQLPSSWVDRWNAWRYLSMLGNPRTHIRNVLGNAAFEPAILVKNTIGTALEHVFLPPGERTKSLSGLLPRTGGEAMKFAQADFQEMKEIITGGGKMNPSDMIRERQRVFHSGPLEWIRKQNFNFLEAGDGVFLEHHYVRAMTQFLKANRVDTGTLDADSAQGARVLSRAREYAVKEAQKATYRDFSLTAQVISQASRKMGTAGRVLIEGLLPFKKTPINVLKRGVEYSPVGLAKAVTYDADRLRKGKISASEWIDSISAGLTGTGIAALGWLLSRCGVLVGGGSDDQEQDFRDALGAQSWALRFGDTTYTIDWLAPSSMPLFVGAGAQRLCENGLERNGRGALDAALSIAEPMTQMSMLDGLNSMLSGVRYGENPLSDLFTGAVADYVNQAVPTLLGQIARTVDPVRRTTYDDKNSGIPSAVQKTLQTDRNKIPFLSQRSAAYLDLWGREQFGGSVAERVLQNFISPGYLRNEKLSDMESELIRLYQATGDGSALPGKAAKSFSVGEGDGRTAKYLTAGEYRLFAETRGAMLYSGLSEITASGCYQAMDDVDRLEAVRKMIALSNAVAKTGVSDYELTGWYAKAVDGKEKYAISFSSFVLAYAAQAGAEGLRDQDGETIANSSGLRKMQAIYAVPGLTDKQRAYLFEACGVGKSVQHYNKAKVDEELRKMEKKAAK